MLLRPLSAVQSACRKSFRSLLTLGAMLGVGAPALAEDVFSPPTFNGVARPTFATARFDGTAAQTTWVHGPSCTTPVMPSPNGYGDSGDTYAQDLSPFQTASAGSSLADYAPYMMGDFFGSGGSAGVSQIVVVDPTFTYNTAIDPVVGSLPSPGSGGGVGRVKLSENGSPIPRDRVFVNTSYFNNVNLGIGGTDVTRVTPGFEKTFFDGMMSIEMRAPFAYTLDSTADLRSTSSVHDTQFGNMSFSLKTLLLARPTFALAAGLQVAIPTASDVRVYDSATGDVVVRVRNDAVHLMPYLGGLWTPNSRFFAQGFLQIDVDANGNAVSLAAPNGTIAMPYTPLTRVGTYQDATFMYSDFGMGYWIRQANDGLVRGVAPIFEVHYNASLNSTDSIQSGGTRIGTVQNNIDVVNLTAGVNLLIGDRSTLTTGYVIPVGVGSDKQFDGEIRMMLNYLPGRGAPPRNRIVF